MAKTSKPVLLNIVQQAAAASGMCVKEVSRAADTKYTPTYEILGATEHRQLENIEKLLSALRPALWKVIVADLAEATLEANAKKKADASVKPEQKFMG